MTGPLSILVAGDVVLDRHIYRGRRMTLASASAHGLHEVKQWGGAAITHGLIAAVLAADSGPAPPAAVCELGVRLPRSVSGRWPEGLQGSLVWLPQPAADGGKGLVWRIEEAFGYGPAAPDAVRFLPAGPGPGPEAAAPDILILDDAGDGFRREDHADLWRLPRAGAAGPLPRWVVLKLAGPVGRGDLWRRLMALEPRERLVILVSARVLRDGGVRLSRGLSWERTTEHLLAALAEDPAARELAFARHVIVSFEGDGAVWVDFSDPAAPRAQLVFDPPHAEGEWGLAIEGESAGYQSCMAAAITLALANHGCGSGDPDLKDAMVAGVSAMRHLRAHGHGPAQTEAGAFARGQGFPTAAVAQAVVHPTHAFAVAPAPWSPPADESWTVLGDLHGREPGGNLAGFARLVALQGEPMLDSVPYLSLGRLLTVSRKEMESLRGLRRIMEAYRAGSDARPLSIGVFGAPGSGKSFAVKELATGVFAPRGARDYDGWMEFNLSQFEGPGDLIGAFHQVRDRVLQKLTPVVFWDEFDSQTLKWLRSLLAPMQDGRFQEGQVTHTLGRCVFIFAGGTVERFKDFGAAPEAAPAFTLAKGPDFKSRLDDHLDALGPNPDGPGDRLFPVRRAVLIRALLKVGPKDPLEIDHGLLTALIETRKYTHGARSMEKLLAPLRAAREAGGAVRRWRLPAPGQMEDHVDAEEFHDLCARAAPFQAPEVAEKLAPAIHEAWRAVARDQGWPPKYDMPFDELTEAVKAANRAAARRMPEVLALVGLRLDPGLATPEEDAAVKVVLERHMETLAPAEHVGWMAHLQSEDWTFGEPRDDDARRHDCLRPFHELRSRDKEKDRVNVRHYPDFARKAGFRIVGD
ncbi:MAG TPA: RyR domain-containing protein [Caulobacteraceae bacterium]|nr:RyR domain-containing protein [Caulobacteraceae bacterium]